MLSLILAATLQLTGTQLNDGNSTPVAVVPMQELVHEVDTRVGTAPSITATNSRFGRNSEEHGQTIPAVTTPHGMNMWTPQTRETEHKCVAPYYWADTLMQGIRCSHWINGGCTQDYGSFTLMPLLNHLETDALKRATTFSHDDETALPHRYSVKLPHEHVSVEVTASDRASIMRLVYDAPGEAFLVISPNSDESQATLDIDPFTSRITGSNPIHRIYQGKGEPAGYSGNFVIEVSKPLLNWGTYCDSAFIEQSRHISYVPGAGAYVSFAVEKGDTVLVRSANSFVDIAGACRNLAAEIPRWDYDSVETALAHRWNHELGRITVQGGDRTARRKFYGSLWRSSLLPRLASDVDGRYMAFGGRGIVMTKPDGQQYYDDYSMWDTYRALHPLQLILNPDKSAMMMQSLVDKAQQGGWFPIFPCWNSYTAAMIGDHCASVIADAYVKGVRNFDAETAFVYLVQNAYETPADSAYRDGMGRRALKSYRRHGYIPLEDTVPYAYHKREQVSRTIEYAYDDLALSQLGCRMGHNDEAEDLYRRSMYALNVINPTTGYATGRHADGSWVTGDEANPHSFQRYITEGMPCHYSFLPFHIDSLATRGGGRDELVKRLDSLFDDNYYWHGNEPCHHIPWLSTLLGDREKTARRVKYIMESEYLDAPGGLSGNDDAGQMSAWYVFAAMGFYPVLPGTADYVLGEPAFESVTLNLDNGNKFTIKAQDTHPFHPNILLNGTPVTTGTITHNDLTAGGILDFTR